MSDDGEPRAGRTAEAADPLIGKVLAGRYHVTAKLGVGGLGAVYRALQAPLSRPVALKVLHEGLGAIQDLRKRFEREARALASLSHPNIVTITDFGVADGQPYLCMELLEGCTLEALLDRGPLDPARALAIMRQITRGLAFAHGRGIAHRDLKPANVFLQAIADSDDHVKLLDFGLAKFLEADEGGPDATLTQRGMIFGTPAYMAPEQGTGGKVDERVDVYAAGVLLFEMLAGTRPFIADTRADLVRMHLLSPVPKLARVRPGLVVSDELDAIVRKALEKEPSARFNDARAMLAALAGLVEPAARFDPTRADAGRVVVTTDPGVRADEPTKNAEAATLHATPAGALTRAGGAAAGSRVPRRKPRPRWALAAGVGAITVVALVVVVIVIVVAGGGGETARPTPVADAGAQHVVVRPPPPAPPPRAPARNPWRPPLPAELLVPHEQIETGARLSRREIRELYGLVQQHPDDPKPQLLLAHAFSNLGWRSDAIGRYVRAYRLDASCRGDPRMKSELLSLLGSDDVHDRAAEAIVEIYGPEALPEVRTALADPGTQGVARDRLRSLETELARQR